MRNQALRVLCLLLAVGTATAQTQSGGTPSRARVDPPTQSESADLAALRKKADAGDAKAQFNLGLKYASGEGVEKDAVLAVSWYRMAADQGNPQAQYNLGDMYDRGDGVEKDAVQAFSWYRKAADRGHAKAQFKLGIMYHSGDGVEEESIQAVSWYRKAADQG